MKAEQQNGDLGVASNASIPDTKAKPCPFCGGKSEPCVGLHNFTDVSVHCLECAAQGPLFDCQDETSEFIADAETRNVAAAIAAWNRRVSVRPQDNATGQMNEVPS